MYWVSYSNGCYTSHCAHPRYATKLNSLALTRQSFIGQYLVRLGWSLAAGVEQWQQVQRHHQCPWKHGTRSRTMAPSGGVLVSIRIPKVVVYRMAFRPLDDVPGRLCTSPGMPGEVPFGVKHNPGHDRGHMLSHTLPMAGVKPTGAKYDS